LLAGAGLPPDSVIAVGMALPAPVDRTNKIHATTFIPNWRGFQPAQEMSSRLDLPVLVDNDANLCALAEMAVGAARGCRDFVYVKASTGVGCGLIIDGRVYRGSVGTAGEIGHIVVDDQGDLCYCGRRGCLHKVVGAQAITQMLQRSPGERFPFWDDDPDEAADPLAMYDRRLAQVISLSNQGNQACRRVLRDTGRRLGAAIASVCNLLNPERVVVGGVLGGAGGVLFDTLNEEVGWYVSALSGEAVPVVPADLPEGQAELIGALALALREPNDEVSQRLQKILFE
jgi:predicted NBD/HSP70 family sugar kinase